jgi:hypothetical protein
MRSVPKRVKRQEAGIRINLLAFKMELISDTDGRCLTEILRKSVESKTLKTEEKRRRGESPWSTLIGPMPQGHGDSVLNVCFVSVWRW